MKIKPELELTLGYELNIAYWCLVTGKHSSASNSFGNSGEYIFCRYFDSHATVVISKDYT